MRTRSRLTKNRCKSIATSGDEYRQALCLNNIGNVYLAKGQSSDALTYYERALELRKKPTFPAKLARRCTILAKLL